jgi:hypothetical protein
MALDQESIEWFNGLSPEDQQRWKNSIQYEAEDRGMQEKPGTLEKMSFGFDRARSDLGALYDRWQQRREGHEDFTRITREFDDELMHMRTEGLMSRESLADWRERRQAAIVESAQKADIKADEVRQMQLQEREDNLRSKYRTIYGTEYENDLSATVGTLGKYMASPTSALPIGSSWKVAAAIGAGIGAWDVGVRQLAERGEIDAESAAYAAAGGALLAPLLVMGGNRVISWLKDRKSTGTKMTADDITAFSEKIGARVNRPEVLADWINQKIIKEQRMPGEAMSDAQRRKLKKDAYIAFTGEDALADYERRLAVQAQAEHDIEMLARGRIKNVENNPILTEMQRINAIQAERAQILAQKEAMWAEHAVDAGPLDTTQWADAVHWEAIMNKGHNYEKFRRDATLDALDDINKGLVGRVQKGFGKRAALKTKGPSNMALALQDAAMEAGDKEFKAAMSAWRKQSGSISLQNLTSLAGATGGGMYGYYENGAEGAMIGALLGAAVPWGASMIYKRLGTITESIQNANTKAIKSSVGEFIARPYKRLEKMGPSGWKAAELLDKAEMLSKEIGNSFMFNMGRRFHVLNDDEKNNFVRAMQGIEAPGEKVYKIGMSAGRDQVTSVAGLVKEFRGRFKQVLDNAVKLGIIPRERAEKLYKKHYWPRIYDEAKLASVEGQKRWIEVFTEHGFKDRKRLEKAVEHILYGEPELVKQTLKFANKATGDRWVIPAKDAVNLLRNRQKAKVRARSHHLERDRSIYVDDENIINEFLIHDPETVLTEYFYDVGKRFAYAKFFGADDVIWDGVAEGIKKEAGQAAYDWAYQVFWQSVGDSRSRVIGRTAGLTAFEERALGSLTAFETLKLTLAPILNIMQATVNGTTVLAKYGGRKALKNWVTGMRGIMKEGTDFKYPARPTTKVGWDEIKGVYSRDIAGRSAAAYETTILQVVGEGKMQHTIWGAKQGDEAGPIWKMFDVFNNPSKFLRTIQFVRVEQWQRMLAANMGKAHFEDLMDMKIALETGTVAAKDKAKYTRYVNEGLAELRLDPMKRADQYTQDDVLRAMHKFSNTVNFTNDVSKLPLFAKSPYARLALKFKSFSFNQGGLIMDHVIHPAAEWMKLPAAQKAKNVDKLVPLMTYLGVGTPAGMSAHEFRRRIAGDDSDLTWMNRILQGMMHIGGLGIALDAAMGFSDNFGGKVAGALTGPVGSDAWTMWNTLSKQASRSMSLDAFEASTYAPTLRTGAKIIAGGYPMKKQLLDELSSLGEARSGRSVVESLP